MAKSNLINLTPHKLTVSPRLDRILMLSAVKTDDAAEEYAAGLADVKKTGRVRVPLKVLTGTYEVIDGRHRLAWAKEAGLNTVPVQFVSEAESWEIIRSEIFARRSMTKGQKAWLHLWLVPSVADGKTDPRKGDSDIQCPSLEEAAREAGVSR